MRKFDKIKTATTRIGKLASSAAVKLVRLHVGQKVKYTMCLALNNTARCRQLRSFGQRTIEPRDRQKDLDSQICCHSET